MYGMHNSAARKMVYNWAKLGKLCLLELKNSPLHYMIDWLSPTLLLKGNMKRNISHTSIKTPNLHFSIFFLCIPQCPREGWRLLETWVLRKGRSWDIGKPCGLAVNHHKWEPKKSWAEYQALFSFQVLLTLAAFSKHCRGSSEFLHWILRSFLWPEKLLKLTDVFGMDVSLPFKNPSVIQGVRWRLFLRILRHQHGKGDYCIWMQRMTQFLMRPNSCLHKSVNQFSLLVFFW